jgi:Leucine-rich repeat (LRR) protein
MTSLFFNENLLTTIPETIGNMTNLRVLNLENNLISSIPNSIGISNIVQLVLNQNNLSINGLPENILFNGSFTSIFLIGNNNLNCLYKSWWDSEVQISTDLVNGDTNCN